MTTQFDPAKGRAGSSDLVEDSLRLLEFHLVRDRLGVYATFPPAKELALELVPSYDRTEVGQRQAETTEARRFLERGFNIDLSEAKDLRQALQRAALGGVLSGVELRELLDTLKVVREARGVVLRQRDMPVLGAIAEGLPVLRGLEGEIDAAIGRSGEVLDIASPALKDLRAELRSAYQRLMDSLERTMRRLERRRVVQEPVITQRNGRLVLLVKSEMKQHLPGIVHDVSDSGATIFVEPMAAISLGNHWRELLYAEEREEERVLRSLSANVEGRVEDITAGVELLARLGLAMAKARYAQATGAIAPAIIESETQYLSLTDARHPLLEGDVVPISVKLGDGWSVLLITGPNAGGKTVAIKTIGLLTLMAQAGLHVPAREGTFSLFDGVYADIGDQQSIQLSLSTFSSHIKVLKAIMERATGSSLALIDELGASTDPEEGVALAKAILHHFSRRGITTVASTHQRELAAFVEEQPGMLNASVELDSWTLAPTYRLTLGLPGRSYAVAIASRLGLDACVVDQASALLSPAHRQAEGLLRELQEERHLAEERRREVEETLAQAERKRAELDEHLVSIQDGKTELLEEARHELQRKVHDIARRLRVAERALDKSLPQAEVREAQKEVASVRRELRSPEWQPPPSKRGDWLDQIQAGDRVYLRAMAQPVEVITPADKEGMVEVLLGTMRARLPVHQLRAPALSHTTPARDGIYYSRPVRSVANTDLDLRAVRVEEALGRLDGFLDDAIVSGLSSVRILHGVGSGALRSAIRECLAQHVLVKSFAPVENAATDSVTVVELT